MFLMYPIHYNMRNLKIKTIINRAVMLVSLASTIACSKDTEYIIGGKPDTDTFKPVSAMTKYLNSKNAGVVISDATCDYFQYCDTQSVSLCKKVRATGEISVLAELPRPDDPMVDALFTDLHLKDGYLYFMVFDGNNNIPLTWSRVPIDGTDGYEKIREMGIDYVGMMYEEENIYAVYSTDNQSYSISLMDMETGNLSNTTVIPDDYIPKFIYGEYVYCMKYETTDNIFHSMLSRVPLDALEPEMIWNHPENQVVDYFAVGEKLYVVDYYGKQLYATALDGQDRTLLFKDIDIQGMNVDDGIIYFHLAKTSSYDAGIYSYIPATNMLFLVCKSEDLVLGPIFTGTSDIWITKKLENFRLGQPAYIDASDRIHDAKL